MNNLPTERLPTTAILRCFGDVGIFGDRCLVALGAESLGGKDMLFQEGQYNHYDVMQVPKENDANLIVGRSFVAALGK